MDPSLASWPSDAHAQTSGQHESAPRSGPVPGRKKGTACARCRSQKIRCDDERPSCSNCARTGHPCVRANLANNPDAVSYITQLEARLRSLEDLLRRTAPAELDKAPTIEVQGPPVRWANSAPAENQAALDVSPSRWQGEPSALAQAENIDVAGPRPTSPNQDIIFVGGTPNDDVLGLDTTQNLAHSVASASPRVSLSPSTTNQISPDEPLAHEVGMLSLANSKDSKYLGPSSGVPFARLIFSAIPQSQGLATNWASSEADTAAQKPPPAHPFPQHWTSEVDLQHFVDAYFETYQPLYPFLDEDTVVGYLEQLYTTQVAGAHSLQMPSLAEVEASLSPFHSVQIFLVIALGARILEMRLATEFSSERYLATAMQRIGNLPLHDSIEGLQIMLLLTLTSFSFEDGPNAWFLTSNLIASCLDLGFQRRSVELYHSLSPEERQRALFRDHLRKGIFWSTYSLERTLAVVLGRPLTLRDEAVDIEFPGDASYLPGTPGQSDLDSSTTLLQDHDQSTNHSSKRAKIPVCPYAASQFSFRFDQITAEIKLMLYRVVNLPMRFPWPSDLDSWQVDVHSRCDSLLEKLRVDLRRGSRRITSDIAIRSLELKYHHCLMLLCRPSPAIPRPSIRSWRICYDSAVATILINSDLHRFSKLSNSWLTAHTIFVSGITFLYCLWNRPEIKQDTSLSTFSSNAAACTVILKYLARTWSVAADAVVKFERLVHLTANSWKMAQPSQNGDVLAGETQVPMSQAEHTENQKGAHGFVDGPGELGADGAMDSINFSASSAELEPDSFFNELGDMSSWFDLNWLINVE